MKKILFIEDDNLVNEAYQKYFSGFYDLVFSKTASDGIFQAIESKPDLIVLDVMLPGGLNGFDALKKLKLDPQTKDIKVIVLTNLETEAQTALDAGASGYLVKSNVSMEQVSQEIKKYIG